MLYANPTVQYAVALQAHFGNSGSDRQRVRPARPVPREGKRRILIVDDEPMIADTLGEILQMAGFEAAVAYDPMSAIDRAIASCPDVVVADVIMPEKSGIELAIILRTICPNARVVLISGQTSTKALLDDAHRQGYDFELMAKPVPPEELLRKLRE